MSVPSACDCNSTVSDTALAAAPIRPPILSVRVLFLQKKKKKKKQQTTHHHRYGDRRWRAHTIQSIILGMEDVVGCDAEHDLVIPESLESIAMGISVSRKGRVLGVACLRELVSSATGRMLFTV